MRARRPKLYRAYEVKVGQLYRDNDKRIDRTLYVMAITNTGHAICKVGATARTTKIKLSRFRPNSTGYRMIRDENGKLLQGEE